MRSEFEVSPVRVLRGHVSARTAYVVEKVPVYGVEGIYYRRERYWIKKGLIGPDRGVLRLMMQYSKPGRGHRWTKPRQREGGAPAAFALMYTDTAGHVHACFIGVDAIQPHFDARLQLSGIYAQMTSVERERYRWCRWLAQMRAQISGNREWWHWGLWTAAIAGDYQATGTVPELRHDGGWLAGHEQLPAITYQDYHLTVAWVLHGDRP